MSKILFDRIVKATIPRSGNQEKIDKVQEAILKATLAESLLLSDQILINNFGPNLNLVVLEQWLGQDLLEQLLHEKTISFFHSNTSIGFFSEQAAKMMGAKIGFSPLSGAGEDFSLYEGTLNILKEQLGIKDYDAQRLATLIEANNIECNCQEIASLAADCVNENYGVDRTYLDNAQSLYLLGLSAELDCEFISTQVHYTKIIDDHLGEFIDYDKAISKPFNTILDFEDLPNITNLSLADELDFEEIYNLREDKEAVKFREWLQNLNSKDDLDVIKEYTSDIYNPLYRSPKRKVTNFVMNSSFTIGLAFVDPYLAIPGGLAANSFNNFIGSKILKNWSPKFFIQKISEFQSS